MIAPNDDEHHYHVSPDGLLAISVSNDIDGERLVGFHGFDWKVTVSSLSDESALEQDAALERFISDILEDRFTIAVLKRHGELTDVWVTDDPESDRQFLQAGEELVFRSWSGKILDG